MEENNTITHVLPTTVDMFGKHLETGEFFQLSVIFLILLFIGYFVVKHIVAGVKRIYIDYFSPSAKKEKKQKEEVKIIKPSSQEHYVFHTLEALMTELRYIEIENHSAKSIMLQGCLTEMCKNIIENLKLVVFNDINYLPTTTRIEVQSDIDKMLIRSIDVFEQNLRGLYIRQRLDSFDINIIFSAIEKTRKDIRDNVIVEIYKAFSNDEKPDGTPKSNDEIIFNILTVISATAKYMLKSFIEDFEKMNGAFDKYEWIIDLTLQEKGYFKKVL